MGTGHLMRCLALAECLRERSVDVRFICRAHPGNLIALLRERGFQVAELVPPSEAARPNDADYAALFGATQRDDAAETIKALGSRKPDWLVVDQYGIDAEWEGMLRPRAAKLLVIDDLANRRHACDALLDQSYSECGVERYLDRVPEHCRLLLGPRYALLRPEYADGRNAGRRRTGDVRRVLVFFGGSDIDNVTGRAVEALSSPPFRHLEVDVVVGANYAHRVSLEERVAARPGTRLHGRLLHLADLMSSADLAIGAGGATTWERMCLGLPSLVVSTSDNQVPSSEALATAGLIHYLGAQGGVDATAIRSGLEVCLRHGADLADHASGGQAVVDGLGARRVVELLDPTPASALGLRHADGDDVYQYFDWVNDPEVRRQSLKSDPVSLQQHRQWFAAKLAEPASQLFVMEARGLPVGQIRFDRVAGETLIDYSIEHPFRGRGWARQLVALGLDQVRQHDATIFRAEVKESNLPSRAVFRAAGFVDSASPRDSDIRVYRLDSKASG